MNPGELMIRIWSRVMSAAAQTCPKCREGEMQPVYGWNKEECDKCNYTRNV